MAKRLIGDRVLVEWVTEVVVVAVEVEEARACVVSCWEEFQGGRGIEERRAEEAQGKVGAGQRSLTDYWEAIHRASCFRRNRS